MKLIRPHEDYLDSYREAINEDVRFRPNKRSQFRPADTAIENAINYEHGINLMPGHVRETIFWLIDDGEFIGMISIRHELTPSLLRYGGHIGYAVRYTKWGQGYGTKMLSMVLPYCKELGLDRVLITCDDDNIGSARVIEKNGGILENKIINETENGSVLSRRYWIEL